MLLRVDVLDTKTTVDYDFHIYLHRFQLEIIKLN